MLLFFAASRSVWSHSGRKTETATFGFFANCMANTLLKVDIPPSFELHSEASSTTLTFFNDAIFYLDTSNTITSSGRKRKDIYKINFSRH